MCGIAGAFAYHYAANPLDRAELLRVRDHMAARGPDASGEWWSDNGRAGFGHRRLSIIDLSPGGAQPMSCDDGRYVVTFNGEIYNFQELRRGLEARGRVFRGHSDTEVLLHLYAEKGADMVRDLRGMFAFAIWDEARREMFLARDPLGIKPLYYADDGWTLRFASQARALLAGGAVPADGDPAGMTGFFLFGSVPEPFTAWRAIRALPAGATLTVDRAGPSEPKFYYRVADAWREAEERRAPFSMEAARRALADSVRHHVIADVPVGAFLSAGVDSGAMVGLMRDAGVADIQTITVGFDEFRGQPGDETALAAEVARHYGTRHTTRLVTRAEFEADLPLIVEAMDQPSIDGVNTWFVSKAARELGLKVAISGLGGDELLGGYPSFRDVPRWAAALWAPARVPFLGRLARILGAPVAAALGLNPKTAGMIELGGSFEGAWWLKRGLFMPWELREALDDETIRAGLRRLDPPGLPLARLQPGPKSAFARVSTLETSLYMRNQLLRDTDWASMAHSLEVRVPLVDSTLLAELAPFGGDFGGLTGKEVLAAAPTKPLPASIVNRPKTGFTTPVETWMRQSPRLRDVARSGARGAPWARDWSRVVASMKTVASA